MTTIVCSHAGSAQFLVHRLRKACEDVWGVIFLPGTRTVHVRGRKTKVTEIAAAVRGARVV